MMRPITINSDVFDRLHAPTLQCFESGPPVDQQSADVSSFLTSSATSLTQCTIRHPFTISPSLADMQVLSSLVLDSSSLHVPSIGRLLTIAH